MKEETRCVKVKPIKKRIVFLCVIVVTIILVVLAVFIVYKRYKQTNRDKYIEDISDNIGHLQGRLYLHYWNSTFIHFGETQDQYRFECDDVNVVVFRPAQIIDNNNFITSATKDTGVCIYSKSSGELIAKEPDTDIELVMPNTVNDFYVNDSENIVIVTGDGHVYKVNSVKSIDHRYWNYE